VSYAVIGLAALLCVAAVVYAARDRLVDNVLLVVTLVLELGLVVQLVSGLVGVGRIASTAEKATFIAYLLTLPLIPVGTAFLTIKEKSRWAMGSFAVGTFAVAVMTARCVQIWSQHA